MSWVLFYVTLSSGLYIQFISVSLLNNALMGRWLTACFIIALFNPQQVSSSKFIKTCQRGMISRVQ